MDRVGVMRFALRRRDMALLMMEIPAFGVSPTSDRAIIRDEIYTQLKADRYHIHVGDGGRGDCPQILITPREQNKRAWWLKRFYDNPAVFLVIFSQQHVLIQSCRPTGDKVIGTVPYEDPQMLEKLASILSRFGICLSS